MKKIISLGFLVLALCITAWASPRYTIIDKSATTVTSTSAGGSLGLFTRISKSNTIKFNAYTLRIRQTQYRTLDLLVSEVGLGPGPSGYDTNYAGQTWESPVTLRHDQGIAVNVTCPVSDLVVEATFYQLME